MDIIQAKSAPELVSLAVGMLGTVDEWDACLVVLATVLKVLIEFEAKMY